MSWANDYIGLKWKPNGRGDEGLDCWGLVAKVFKEQAKIELPDWSIEEPYTNNGAKRALTRTLDECLLNHRAEFVRKPQDFDICMLVRRRLAFHVGVVVNGGVLHISRHSCGATWERLEQFEQYGGEARFYRWLP